MLVSRVSVSNQQHPVFSNVKEKGFLDRFHTRVKNTADMNDTIVVPRTIFKGYLGIMTGTTLMTLGGLFKSPKIKKSLIIPGALASIYGAWAFVRPYVLKDAPGVQTKK